MSEIRQLIHAEAKRQLAEIKPLNTQMENHIQDLLKIVDGLNDNKSDEYKKLRTRGFNIIETKAFILKHINYLNHLKTTIDYNYTTLSSDAPQTITHASNYTSQKKTPKSKAPKTGPNPSSASAKIPKYVDINMDAAGISRTGKIFDDQIALVKKYMFLVKDVSTTDWGIKIRTIALIITAGLAFTFLKSPPKTET